MCWQITPFRITPARRSTGKASQRRHGAHRCAAANAQKPTNGWIHHRTASHLSQLLRGQGMRQIYSHRREPFHLSFGYSPPCRARRISCRRILSATVRTLNDSCCAGPGTQPRMPLFSPTSVPGSGNTTIGSYWRYDQSYRFDFNEPARTRTSRAACGAFPNDRWTGT